MKPRKKKYRQWTPVEIWWVDAQADESWEFVKDLKTDPMNIRTVGYYLESTEVDIIIARSQSCDCGFEGKMQIPWAIIDKIKILR